MAAALRRPAVLAAVFVLAGLLARGPSLFIDIIDIDETAHIVGSWELLSGKTLYTDFVDNKPPLLYVVYALAQILFGRGLYAVHLLTAAVVVPLTALAASAFHRHASSGLLAGLASIVFGAAFLGHDMLASNAEVLMLLPAAWAVTLVRDEETAARFWRQAGAGALLAGATLIKHQAAAWLPGIALASLLLPGGSALVRLVGLLVGFAAPLVAADVWFQVEGAASAYRYWVFVNNVAYSANPIRASEALGRSVASLLPFLLVTAPLWWLTARSLRLEPSAYRRWLLAGITLLTFAPALLGLRFFPHYFVQFYWPLAVAAAPPMAEMARAPARRPVRILLGYALLLWAGFTASTVLLYRSGWRGRRVYRETDPVYQQVARRLRADPCYPGATLFVWGYAPAFYYAAELPPATRFAVLAQSGLTEYVPGNLEGRPRVPGQLARTVPAHWDLLMQDLERNRATFVLDTAPAALYRWDRYPLRDFPRLERYLARSFQPIGSVEGVQIYRRRDCDQRPDN